MSYQILRRIPTMAGATVDVGLDRHGKQVVIKTAQTPAAALALAAYSRHLKRLGEIESIAVYYPPVLEVSADRLVMPYYDGGSLDAAGSGDRDTFMRLVAEAVAAVVGISHSRTLYEGVAGGWSGVAGARRFWREQLRTRLDRLAATGADLTRNPFRDIVAWLEGGDFDRLLDHTVHRPLGLAAHGDLGLNNVMLTGSDSGSDSGGECMRFIDLRGQTPWEATLPWWDPMLDLATLLTFHCLIEPALGIRDGVALSGTHNRLTLSVGELWDIFELCPAMSRWAVDDPHWRTRVRLGVLIRLLGSVSSQLTSAPRERTARAEQVTNLLRAATSEIHAW